EEIAAASAIEPCPARFEEVIGPARQIAAQLGLCQVRWVTPAGELVAIEPRPDEVVRYAGVLAAAYNDPRNAPLLGHTEDVDEDDVLAHYADVAQAGGHNFLVFVERSET